MSGLLIDRHALASSADRVNRAWRTFGWTPAIAGARAGRLEEVVPWGSGTTRSAEPARLKGRVADVLHPSNYDRLHFAFLALDGRLGLSVWGAIGAPEPEAGEWRILTHTLLFDRGAFRALAGYPFGLIHRAGEPAPWFLEMAERLDFASPGPLEPIRLEPSSDLTAAFERARREEVARLRDRLLEGEAGDAARLARNLGAVYESLHRTRDGGEPRHTAVRTAGPQHAELLVRLAWLSLPLEERAEVSFSTEQRRSDRPSARLVVLAHDERGAFVPGATERLEGEALDRPRSVSRGRRHWAKAVVRHAIAAGEADGEAPDAAGAAAEPAIHAFAHLATRADIRGWRLVERDDLGPAVDYADWEARWYADGPRVELAVELLGIERRRAAPGAPRLRAAGYVLGLAGRAAGEDRGGDRTARAREQARAVLDALPELAPADAAPLLRGLVRALCRGADDDRLSAGVVRCLAATGTRPLAYGTELLRLLDRERVAAEALLAEPAGAALLFRAATDLARADDEGARRLAAEAVGRLDHPDDALEWLREYLRLPEPVAAGWAVTFLELAEGRWPERFPDVALGFEWLLPAVTTAGSAGEAVARYPAEPGAVADVSRESAGPGPPDRAPASPSGAAGVLARYLGRPVCLDRILDEARGPALERFLSAVRPDRAQLKAAFERRAARAAGPDPVGEAIATLAASGCGDDARALLGFGLEAYPPASDGTPWQAWIGRVPVPWLAREDVLGGFERALRGAAAGVLAPALVRRVIGERWDAAPGDGAATVILRLLELERRAHGHVATIDWIAAEAPPDRAAALLVQLLTAPAPLPLFLAIRRSLIRAAAERPLSLDPRRPWAEALEEYSPAAYAALVRGPARECERVYLAA